MPAETEWHVHNQRALYMSDWLNLWVEDIEVPQGPRIQHHVLRMPRHSVTAVVTDDLERVLMIWRHRFITDTWGWEIPAGWIDEGESAHDAVLREVEEETGWRCHSLTLLCSYYALPGISDQHFTVFHGRGATYQGPPRDESEASKVDWIPLADIRRLIDDALLTDGPTITALSFAIAFR